VKFKKEAYEMLRNTVAGLLVSLLLALIGACSDAPRPVTSGGGAESAASSSGVELRYKVPAGWVEEPSASSMRVAQYRLPHADGDSEDASLILYYFGQGQGGGVEANLDRWIGQMEQPDGSSSKDRSHTENLTVNDLKVTLLDVTGTYTAEMTPGSGSRQNKPNYRLRAAVIETPKGAYFAKLAGPEKTIERWDADFKAYVKSFEFR
jgi:hypothetical protein